MVFDIVLAFHTSKVTRGMNVLVMHMNVLVDMSNKPENQTLSVKNLSHCLFSKILLTLTF